MEEINKIYKKLALKYCNSPVEFWLEAIKIPANENVRRVWKLNFPAKTQIESCAMYIDLVNK